MGCGIEGSEGSGLVGGSGSRLGKAVLSGMGNTESGSHHAGERSRAPYGYLGFDPWAHRLEM